MEPDEFLQKNFQYFQQWHHWLRKADGLRSTALSLFDALLPKLREYDAAVEAAYKKLSGSRVVEISCDEPEIYPPFWLFGSALENLFKAVLLSREPALIAAHRLSPNLLSHDLPELADKIGITLSSRERQYLDWAKEVVIWKARYSVPTRSKDATFFYSMDRPSEAHAAECMADLEEVYARASKLLPPRPLGPKWGVAVRLDD